MPLGSDAFDAADDVVARRRFGVRLHVDDRVHRLARLGRGLEHAAVVVADGDRGNRAERAPAVEAHAADLDQVAVGERVVEHGHGAGGRHVGVLRRAVVAAIAIEQRNLAVQIDRRHFGGMRGADVDDVGVGVAGARALEHLELRRHRGAVDGGGERLRIDDVARELERLHVHRRQPRLLHARHDVGARLPSGLGADALVAERGELLQRRVDRGRVCRFRRAVVAATKNGHH